MDQSVEVKSPAPQPQPEPEPEPQQPHAGSFVGDESVDVDIGKGSFKQHDLSATTLLLESSPNRVECVATSSENLDHTVYIFKVFTPDGREWYGPDSDAATPSCRVPRAPSVRRRPSQVAYLRLTDDWLCQGHLKAFL